MSWLQVVPVVVACIVVFWAPGLLLSRAAGVRGMLSLAIAPAVTTGLLGLASVLAAASGIAWTWPIAATATAVALLVVVLVRGRPRQSPQEPVVPVLQHGAVALVAAVAFGVLAQLVPVAAGMQRPDRVHNAFDALFHLSAVQGARRAGVVTPMSLADLAAPESSAVAFYPHAWHAVTALVPQWSGAIVTVNVAFIVPVALATVLGVTALTLAALPGATAAATVAPALAASGVAVPLAIALQPGLIPNAFALSLVPGALACVVVACRRRTRDGLLLVGLATTGIGLVHPNAGLSLVVLSAPWVLPALAGPVRRLVAGWRGRAVVVASAATVLAGVVVLVTSSTAQEVAEIRQKPPQPYAELAARLASGNLGEWTAYPIVVTAFALFGAVVLVRQRRSRALVAAVVLSVLLYGSAASPIDAVSALTNLWYTETRRIAPLVGMLCMPLAAFGLVHAARTAAQRVELPARMGVMGARRVLAGVLLVLAVGLGPLVLHGLADDAFTQSVPEQAQAFDRVPYLDVAEEEMIRTVGEVLDPEELLLGSSFSGAGHLAALTGQRVNQPYHTTSLGPRELYVSEHLTDLRTDPLVCENVRALGARAVYVDPLPLHSTYWLEASPRPFMSAPRGGVVLARGGVAAVYSLDECY